MVTACACGHDGLRLISLGCGWGRAGPPVVQVWGAEGVPASMGVCGLRGRDTPTRRGGLWPATPRGGERGVGGRGRRARRAPGAEHLCCPADEQSFLLRDAEAEVLFSFSLEESLKRAHVSPLFKVRPGARGSRATAQCCSAVSQRSVSVLRTERGQSDALDGATARPDRSVCASSPFRPSTSTSRLGSARVCPP